MARLINGYPFELPDFWRCSAVAKQEGGDYSPFSALHITADQLELHESNPSVAQAFELLIPEPLELENGNGVVGGHLDGIKPIQLTVGPAYPALVEGVKHSDDDVWNLTGVLEGESHRPALRTWDAFDRKDVAYSDQTAYLSEAGPEVFDAALSTHHRSSTSVGVLPQDIVFRACCNLALGRSSVFFQWDATMRSFKVTLPYVSISGLSIECTSSLMVLLTQYGTLLRRLKHFAENTTLAKPSCATVTALRHCFSDILDIMDASVNAVLPKLRTLLQLQHALERPRHILDLLQELQEACRDGTTDEEAIAKLSDCVHLNAVAGSQYVAVLRAVLTRVCAPWLRSLARDMGLMDQPGFATSTQVAQGDATVDFGINVSLAEDSIVSEYNSSLLSDEDRRLLRATKAGLRLLRKHLPDQTLSLPQRDGQAALGPGMGLCRSASKIPLLANYADLDDAGKIGQGVTPCMDDGTQLAQLEPLDSRMTSVPESHWLEEQDELRSSTEAVLQPEIVTVKTMPALAGPDALLDPIACSRSMLKAQSNQINRIVLRYLFGPCQLRRHLATQRAFHMFGNGEFVSRLRTVLFSSETQTAERRRGAIPTAQPMGLNLGARESQTWPPASSELRLALTGILQEVHQSQTSASHRVDVERDLPGNLSFAIRELPEADIERVLDPRSLYALDFLRLQYNPPAPLDAVLTPASMQQYDDIFRSLLRLLRVLDLTTNLCRQFVHSMLHRSGSAGSFAREAHHVICAVLSHFLDLSIAAPWDAFMHSLDEMEQDEAIELCESNARVTSMDELRTLHGHCLETIRGRLYLRRRQESIRGGLDMVWTALLEAASFTGEPGKRQEAEITEKFATFRQAVRTLVDILQKISGSPPKRKTASDVEDTDAEMARVLLSKINWNRCYGDTNEGNDI